MIQDKINSCFEFIAGIIFWFNVFKIKKDKDVKGISYWSCVFFLMWAYWNIYYYFTLGQIFSSEAAIFLVIPNTIWMYLMEKYRKNL